MFSVLGCLLALTTYAQVSETHVRLTNLPHVYINTFSGKPINSKTEYTLAQMYMVDEHDSIQFFDSLEIRGRGNSTWNMAKKPYKLKFHEKEKLLGKGYAKTKKWTLLANHADKTMMRNALTSILGQRLGLKFNPAAKFVDLTLNGDYVGTYQFSDQIDVRPHRVNITEQDVPLTDESNITGGYLLEADGFSDFQNGRTGFYTPRTNVPIRIHYPDEDEIQTIQYQYIRNLFYDFEATLFSSDFTDSIEGYRPLLDSLTLANWYVATEVSGNPDGFFSTYFYKERDDNHFYFGPLWDYDIAYGNDNRIGDTSRKLMKDVGFGSSIFRPWIVRMWEDPWFVQLINRRYNEALDSGLEAHLLASIDSLSTLLQESQELNYERWSINTRNLRECVLYSTYDEYVQDLRRYVTIRLPYLKQTLGDAVPQPPKPIVPDFQADTLTYYSFTNLGARTVLDVDLSSGNLIANNPDEESQSQQWRIFPLSNGYLFIVNRATGMAMNDPTQGESTATTNVGTRLNTAQPDSADIRQQWNLVQQGDDGYNFINHYSQHAANLSGGSSAPGTGLLSYTSDGRNSSSRNRIWNIEGVGQVTDGIASVNEEAKTGKWPNSISDYALAYSPLSHQLHFGGENPAELSFMVRLYDSAGHLLRLFRASDGCNLQGFPCGLYIVSWTVDNRTRSVKFHISKP